MKKKLLLIAVLLAIVVASTCFPDDGDYQLYIPGYLEPIYGTWVNRSYAGNEYYPQKFVVFNWGYTENYHKQTDESYSGRNTFTLIEKWKDEEGNTWYKDFEQTSNGGRCFYINRISKDGNTYELMYYLYKLPKENMIDPSASNYRIFYRQ